MIEIPDGPSEADSELAAAIGRAIREETARALDESPREPGVYLMPCGECVVDFSLGADGVEHWAVAGDPREHTRESALFGRHGDHPWQRLYTLEQAAEVLGLSDGTERGEHTDE